MDRTKKEISLYPSSRWSDREIDDCSKMGSQFEFLHVKNSNFAAFMDSFTSNTFVMVVLADSNVSAAATLINIKSASKHFEKLEHK